MNKIYELSIKYSLSFFSLRRVEINIITIHSLVFQNNHHFQQLNSVEQSTIEGVKQSINYLQIKSVAKTLFLYKRCTG